MSRLKWSSIAAVALILGFSSRCIADSKAEAPDLREVYDLIRAHLSGMAEADLNRAAVKALLSSLSPKVALLTNGTSDSATETKLVSKINLFDNEIAYLRVGRVEDGLAKAVRDNYDQLGTNKLKGLVLDLRYTRGNDYAAAASVADLFLSKERPLLDWGNGVVKAQEKKDAITLPVAILVNRQTAAAAEALASVLREAGVGLILGNTTAGQATIAEEFPLKSGQRLRIATSPVRLGDGSALPSEGLKPDIPVEVKTEEEHAYYADAFVLMPRTNDSASAASTNNSAGTNRTARRNRINEAELVRERRETPADGDSPARRVPDPDKPVVHDPALARAIDLLKGLAVVRQSRS